jgi:hypothetical protein
MGAVQKIGLSLLLAWACLAGSPALAQKRVALVIGNSSYDKVARLANPSSDAGLVAETLKAVGFDSVDLRHDLKVNDMRRALRASSTGPAMRTLPSSTTPGMASRWMASTT